MMYYWCFVVVVVVYERRAKRLVDGWRCCWEDNQKDQTRSTRKETWIMMYFVRKGHTYYYQLTVFFSFSFFNRWLRPHCVCRGRFERSQLIMDTTYYATTTSIMVFKERGQRLRNKIKSSRKKHEVLTKLIMFDDLLVCPFFFCGPLCFSGGWRDTHGLIDWLID